MLKDEKLHIENLQKDVLGLEQECCSRNHQIVTEIEYLGLINLCGGLQAGVHSKGATRAHQEL